MGCWKSRQNNIVEYERFHQHEVEENYYEFIYNLFHNEFIEKMVNTSKYKISDETLLHKISQKIYRNILSELGNERKINIIINEMENILNSEYLTSINMIPKAEITYDEILHKLCITTYIIPVNSDENPHKLNYGVELEFTNGYLSMLKIFSHIKGINALHIPVISYYSTLGNICFCKYGITKTHNYVEERFYGICCRLNVKKDYNAYSVVMDNKNENDFVYDEDKIIFDMYDKLSEHIGNISLKSMRERFIYTSYNKYLNNLKYNLVDLVFALTK